MDHLFHPDTANARNAVLRLDGKGHVLLKFSSGEITLSRFGKYIF
jgi:hypothetical protein